MKITIVIYEDKTKQRESLCELLREYDDEFKVVGAFFNCDEVEMQMETLNPDIVLMDKDMPGTDGLEGLKLITKNFPEIAVIMLTGLDDKDSIYKCLEAGAAGYIKKGMSYLKLLDCIRVVYNGGTLLDPAVGGKIVEFFAKGDSKNENFEPLSAREYEALKLLCDGLSQKLIADRMQITLDTVNAHMRKIFKKLHVNSATAAVSKAIREGLA